MPLPGLLRAGPEDEISGPGGRGGGIFHRLRVRFHYLQLNKQEAFSLICPDGALLLASPLP